MIPPRKLKVGILTTDNRHHFKEYHRTEPVFGTAITALLQGLEEFPEEIEVHVISATQKPLQSPARLAPNIFYHSLLVPRIGWLRTGYQGCVRAVRAKVRDLGLDLVHGQGTERDCALEAVFSGCPNLLTLHGNMRAVARAIHAPPFSYHWFQARLESLAIRRTNGVFCNSTYTESWVRPLNPRSVPMPNPVRKLFFSPYPETVISSAHELRLLVVGLICSYKQPLEILRALRKWRETGAPRFRCLWIGGISGEKSYTRSFLAEMGSAQKAGWADHQAGMGEAELRGVMDASQVLIHIPREEAFGLVVAEAMLRGMHVVGAKAGGVPDFARIYPGIVLVDPAKTGDWIQALQTTSAKAFSRISRTSWSFMAFHPREIAQRHLESYRQLLALGS